MLEQIECIAAEHHTSFNHVVVSMIEAIPDDENIVVSTNQGEPLVGMGSAAGQAYLNVCRRLLGQNVPMESPGETAGILAKLSRILRRA